MATAKKAKGIISVERLRILFGAFLRDEKYDKAKRITAYLPGCEAKKKLETIYNLIRESIKNSLKSDVEKDFNRGMLEEASEMARLLPTKIEREETLQTIIVNCMERNDTGLSSLVEEIVGGLETLSLKKRYQNILAIYE